MPLYEDVFAEPEYRLYIGLTVSQKRTLEEGGTIFGSYQGRFGLRRKPAEVPCTCRLCSFFFFPHFSSPLPQKLDKPSPDP